jgi:hypothetical protein
MTLKERISRDESSLTSESESEICREDLPLRQRLVKASVLLLGFSSSSELEESSLEKSRSLGIAHAQDIIFWNFFFLLSTCLIFWCGSIEVPEIDQHFRNRHWEFIFWCGSIEVPKIHADSPPDILLLYRYNT